MEQSFSSKVLLSFAQWLDNRILQDGVAFTNTTSQMYYRPDGRLGTGYVTYQAPFKPFAYDSSVSGAIVINSVSGSFGELSKGQLGLAIDYENGRAIFPANFGVDKIVSGTYSFKDFGIYFSNQSQETIIQFKLKKHFVPFI